MIKLVRKPPVAHYFEFDYTVLKSLRGDEVVVWSLERETNGSLTPACKERTVQALRKYFKRKRWHSRPIAVCTVGGRGVSLRRLSLPMVAESELRHLIELKIESEFPLSPAELAWGYQKELPDVPEAARPLAVVVAAVRKESIEEYQEIMFSAGACPVFCLGSIARNLLCDSSSDSYATLEIGRNHSELTGFDQGMPTFIRVLPWEASISSESLDGLTTLIQKHWPGSRLYLFGDLEIATYLAEHWEQTGSGRQAKVVQTDYQPPSLVALKKHALTPGAQIPLVLQVRPPKMTKGWKGVVLSEWTIRALALLGTLLVWPYLEALLVKPIVGLQVNHFMAKAIPMENLVGREFTFLQGYKQSLPPYLEILYLLSNSSPPGARFEAIDMNRKGEIQLRCSMGNGDQVADFRSKLISSGFFTVVTLDEQVPTPNRQRVNLRMTLQAKPLGQIPLQHLGPEIKEPMQSSPLTGSPKPPASVIPSSVTPVPAAAPDRKADATKMPSGIKGPS